LSRVQVQRVHILGLFFLCKKNTVPSHNELSEWTAAPHGDSGPGGVPNHRTLPIPREAALCTAPHVHDKVITLADVNGVFYFIVFKNIMSSKIF
jgi:hypothetical protein